MRVDDKVEVDGKQGVIVRSNVFGLKNSKGVVVQFKDGRRKMYINKQMKCICEGEH
jgi:hypothetical protein